MNLGWSRMGKGWEVNLINFRGSASLSTRASEEARKLRKTKPQRKFGLLRNLESVTDVSEGARRLRKTKSQGKFGLLTNLDRLIEVSVKFQILGWSYNLI